MASSQEASGNLESDTKPALQKPLDYMLVWSPNDGSEDNYGKCGYFWLPKSPAGYKSIGFLVTDSPSKPDLDEVRVVREDLTDQCEIHKLILNFQHESLEVPFQVWSTRPKHRGMLDKGISTGTFFCSCCWTFGDDLCIACLKNLNPYLHAMPTLDQVHALIKHYGPTVFFHPDEEYLPSSIAWFFKSGSVLYRSGLSQGEAIDADGSNLPAGGRNDGEYWIDLPNNEQNIIVKRGNLESAKLYIHVKPALGGTFTDIAMWVFCPYNGPAILKAGVMNIPLSNVGQHVGDWEHFTLRISNFTGELWGIYFSQHSGGQWVAPHDLEFIDGNRAIVYSSKNGHASFPHPGTYIQGSQMLRIGIRNDVARSDLYINSNTAYEIVSAEYLGNGVVVEPCWLQFMRKWGPTVVYDSRAALDRIIKMLPVMVQYSMENMFNKLPLELYGEEGPTGPKEKNNWLGDERG
ncbi:hypothetical protein CDL15_Pgr014149 [Punica granatum]|nr:hypothetical protein CDL15_Pgr014148 [Punica granatum]OWM84579.1 hypothetical protein CDL15_Pgr014149 [Punica granatum]